MEILQQYGMFVKREDIPDEIAKEPPPTMNLAGSLRVKLLRDQARDFELAKKKQKEKELVEAKLN